MNIALGKFGKYKVELSGMQADSAEYEFTLDNQFFMDLDELEVQKGKLVVSLEVKKAADVFLLDFRIDGIVIVPCDRCLDEMELPIFSTDRLKVKMGTGFAEEDDVVFVSEEEGCIDVAWFIYEFIVLHIPIKHIHAPGKCNKSMMSKLNEHLLAEVDEYDSEGNKGGIRMFLEAKESDNVSLNENSRWYELKKIIDNN